jgi:von Willebrand factor type A domain
MLLDASGSVNKENHKWDTARLIAGNFLLKAPAELHPALVVFSDHIVDTIDFSCPPSEIVLRLTGLKEGRGRTALLDALMYSAKLLRPFMPGDAVYLISDGGENSSQTRLREVSENSWLLESECLLLGWPTANIFVKLQVNRCFWRT